MCYVEWLTYCRVDHGLMCVAGISDTAPFPASERAITR